MATPEQFTHLHGEAAVDKFHDLVAEAAAVPWYDAPESVENAIRRGHPKLAAVADAHLREVEARRLWKGRFFGTC